MNNTTVAAVFTPILISIAGQNPSVDALQLVVPLTLATTFGYSLPSASGRMALISATGIVERRDMIRYGLVVTVVSSLALTGLFYAINLLGWM
jgi:sodium-dependent dicarboxylate transporter 2/3/5